MKRTSDRKAQHLVLKAAGLTIALVGGSFAWLWSFKGIQPALEVVVVGFVINFAAALFAVTVRLRNFEARLDKARLLEELGSSVVDFWTVPSPDKEWTIVSGSQLSGNQTIHLSKASFHTFDAIRNIEHILYRIYQKRPPVLYDKNFKDWDKFFHNNVVLLGGVEAVPFLKEFYRELGMPGLQQRITEDKKETKRRMGDFVEASGECCLVSDEDHKWQG